MFLTSSHFYLNLFFFLCQISCNDSFQFFFIILSLIFKKFFVVSEISKKIIFRICQFLFHGESLHWESILSYFSVSGIFVE